MKGSLCWFNSKTNFLPLAGPFLSIHFVAVCIAGELKEVPKEFQKGLEEGEAQAKTLKQKALEEEKKE